MAKPNWGELHQRFLAEHAKTGISPKDWCQAQGLNYSSAKRYIKITSYGANSHKENAKVAANSHKGKQVKRSEKRNSLVNSESGVVPIPPGAKPERRGGVTNYPPFQPGNQHALKHGGYARRMLISDATNEDTRALTLDDELFWLRAANLTAAENIGRWRAQLEIADDDKAKDLHSLISSAEKAMHRNTARIESLEYTRSSMEKQRIDMEYRAVIAEKERLTIAIMKDGDSDNAIVVHNTLPIPGR